MELDFKILKMRTDAAIARDCATQCFLNAFDPLKLEALVLAAITESKSIVTDTKNKSGQQDEPAVKSQQPKPDTLKNKMSK